MCSLQECDVCNVYMGCVGAMGISRHVFGFQCFAGTCFPSRGMLELMLACTPGLADDPNSLLIAIRL